MKSPLLVLLKIKEKHVQTTLWDIKKPLYLQVQKTHFCFVFDKKGIHATPLKSKNTQLLSLSKEVALSGTTAHLVIMPRLSFDAQTSLNKNDLTSSWSFFDRKSTDTLMPFMFLGVLFFAIGIIFSPKLNSKEVLTLPMPKKYEHIVFASLKMSQKVHEHIQKLLQKSERQQQQHAASSHKSKGVPSAQPHAKKTSGARKFLDHGIMGAISGLISTGPHEDVLKDLSSLREGHEAVHEKRNPVVTNSRAGVESAVFHDEGKVDIGTGDANYHKTHLGSITLAQGNAVHIVSDDLDVQAGLTTEQVGRVIHHHMNEIEYCQQSASLQGKSAQTKIVLAFTVNPEGRVSAANIKEAEEKGLADCICQHLLRWPFPKPVGGVSVTVTYPFIFRLLD